MSSQTYFNSLVDILKPIQANYSENFIPLEFIGEMLDRLPQEVWYNPYLKWFDPNCGLSQFISYVYQRLMRGLETQIPNPKERRIHIITKMLYVCEISDKNLEIYKKLMLKPDESLEDIPINTISESFLEMKSTDFSTDIILGYPPYEDKKYLNYLKKSMEILRPNGLILFISPNLVLEHLTLIHNDFLDKFYQIRVIINNIPFKSNYTCFLLEKETYEYPTRFEFYFQKQLTSNSLKITEKYIIPRILTEIDSNIIRKITSNMDNYELKEFIIFDNKSLKIKKDLIQKSIIMEKPHPDYRIKIIDTINRGMTFPGKYYYINESGLDFELDKVVFNKKGSLMPHICPKKQYTYSNNFVYIIADISNDLYSILMLMNSDIIKYLDYQFSKNDSDNMGSLKNIKKLNKPVKNINDLYKIYGLNSLEVQRIRLLTTL